MTKKPHPIDIIVGENLRRMREHAGLSQSGLADGIGVTYQQVQKYESGANRLAASRLWECAVSQYSGRGAVPGTARSGRLR